MQIIQKEINIDIEKRLATAYIVSDHFLQQINPIHKSIYFKASYIKAVTGWSIEYFRKYKKAPGRDIQNIFNLNKNDKNLRSDMADIIEEFLSELSQEYEENGINEHYELDNAEKYFSTRNIELMQENVSAHLQAGEIDKAEAVIAKHMRPKRPIAGSIDVIRDVKDVIKTLSEEQEPLLLFPNGLGELIGPIERQDFMAFIGPMKRGKTFWLEDIAVRAMLKGLKVLFISMEMPKKPMYRRIYQNFLGETRLERTIEMPYFDDNDNVCIKEVNKKGLKAKSILTKAKSLEMLINNGAFRLLCYPTRGANVSTIRTELENLAHYENFIPDVIVVDYADILAPEQGGSKDVRHQINDTWAELRALAQQIDGLVVTATQSDRSTFSKDVKEENTAEDIRKLAHVTHMIALNQSKEEKQKYIMRLSMLVSRNEEFNTLDELTVIYNYAIGKAYLDSRWKKNQK